MKFKVTPSNIEIDPQNTEVERIVLAVARIFVPKLTPKLYFYGKSTESYPLLVDAANFREGFIILDPQTNAEAVAKRVRVVHQDDRLFVVPQLHGSLMGKKWKQVCRDIQDALETQNNASKRTESTRSA